MFGFGRNKNESFTKSESPVVTELRQKLKDATSDLYAASEKVRGNISVARDEDFPGSEGAERDYHQSDMEAFRDRLEFWVELANQLGAELNKTPGQRLSDTLALESEALTEKTDRAIDLLRTAGPRNPEFIELQDEILKRVKDVDFLKELNAKLNNRQAEEVV